EALSEEDPRGIVKALRELARERRKHRTARAIEPNLAPRLDVDFSQAAEGFVEWAESAPPAPAILGLSRDLERLTCIYRDCLASAPTFRHLWELAHPPELDSMRYESSDLREPRWGSLWGEQKNPAVAAELRENGKSLFN